MEASSLTQPTSIPGLRGPTALLRLQSDERLIALTRSGQPAAFEVLCSRYQSRLLSFCRHMLSSREDAEDVLQEVFAAAFNAVLADQREINVRPWLYRIARNRSLNHLRRASAIGVDSMDVHYADGGISTGDKVIRRESFRELIADVHHLPETQRTALLLREIDALSYDQIADAMETTVPSVKSLLVRARISLAEAAEARKLSCEEVRFQLGEVAEGLVKLSAPARRHVRSCERCLSFKKQLKDNNRALAIIMPVGPLLLVKKALFAKLGFAKLGSTAGAGGAHVAGSAGASAGAGAMAGAGAGAGAGASAGGGLAGGLMTAGAGALATKAAAGLAAAAIVTAGAVAADHASVVHHHPHAAASAESYASAPVVVHHALQPVSATHRPARRAHRAHLAKIVKADPPVAPVAAAPAVEPPAKPVAAAAPAEQVTEVTSETTELPPTTTTTPPPTTTVTTSTSETTTTPPPPAAPAPPSGEASPPAPEGTVPPAPAPEAVLPSTETGGTPSEDADGQEPGGEQPAP